MNLNQNSFLFFSGIHACNKYIDERFKIKNGVFDKYAYLLRIILSYPHNYHICIQNNIKINNNIVENLNNFNSYPKNEYEHIYCNK